MKEDGGEGKKSVIMGGEQDIKRTETKTTEGKREIGQSFAPKDQRKSIRRKQDGVKNGKKALFSGKRKKQKKENPSQGRATLEKSRPREGRPNCILSGTRPGGNFATIRERAKITSNLARENPGVSLKESTRQNDRPKLFKGGTKGQMGKKRDLADRNQVDG